MDKEYWNSNGPAVYTEADINEAIEAGALTEEAARNLRNYVAGRSVADEEHFRLVGGFNDIFVTLASLMSLIALFWLLPGIAGGIFGIAFSWGVAEYFVRRKRLALTAIVLLLSYIGSIYYTLSNLLGNFTDSALAMIIIASVAVLIGTVFHWRRFHVPITIAGGVSACVAALISFVMTLLGGDSGFVFAFVILFCGLAVFTFAMYWDSRDPYRRTRKSDIAFWLHLLAAPMLVHPVFYFLGVFEGNITLMHAFLVILMYVFMAFISVCVDRRALMVSSLAYVLYALSYIMSETGALDMGIALAALVVGSALLSLSALWQPVRRSVVKNLPDNIRVKLPPV